MTAFKRYSIVYVVCTRYSLNRTDPRSDLIAIWTIFFYHLFSGFWFGFLLFLWFIYLLNIYCVFIWEFHSCRLEQIGGRRGAYYCCILTGCWQTNLWMVKKARPISYGSQNKIRLIHTPWQEYISKRINYLKHSVRSARKWIYIIDISCAYSLAV